LIVGGHEAVLFVLTYIDLGHGVKHIHDAKIVSHDRELAAFFESMMDSEHKVSPKLAANWLLGPVAAALNRTDAALSSAKLNADQLAKLILRVEDGTISNNIARNVFEEVWEQGLDPDTVIDKNNLRLIDDDASIKKIVDDVLAANPKQLEEYRAGNVKIFGYFVGQAMKASQGKVDPKKLNAMLKNIIDQA
jgi:aspartyl-tRNA(Asn)/glutamyl-tRNA(Gln) amidotransferase subunit B